MDRNKRNVRLEAAKAFMASLDQLGDVLESSAGVDVSLAPKEVTKDKSKLKSAPPNPSATELDAFEQAVAELEAYIEGQSTHS